MRVHPAQCAKSIIRCREVRNLPATTPIRKRSVVAIRLQQLGLNVCPPRRANTGSDACRFSVRWQNQPQYIYRKGSKVHLRRRSKCTISAQPRRSFCISSLSMRCLRAAPKASGWQNPASSKSCCGHTKWRVTCHSFVFDGKWQIGNGKV